MLFPRAQLATSEFSDPLFILRLAASREALNTIFKKFLVRPGFFAFRCLLVDLNCEAQVTSLVFVLNSFAKLID